MADRVVIGFADALAAPESAWDLADHGFEVHAFTRRGSRPPVAASRRVRITEVTAPEQDARACVSELAAAVDRIAPVAVLPLDDHAVWLCDRADLSAPLAGPVGAAAEFALDKRLQIEAASAAGLAVPGPFGDSGAKRHLMAVVGDRRDGPWIVKPALAVLERDGRLVRPTGRLARTASEIDDVTAGIDGPVLVQQAVSGVGEGVFGLATENGVQAWSAHRRIRMMNPRGSGSSACRSIPVAEPLRAAADKLLTAIGWRGLFMVELLRDEQGVPWFMEVNGRAWGSMALALRRGYTYPTWAVQQSLDSSFLPDVPVVAPDVVCRHLGREIVHLLAVLRGPRGADVGRWPGRWETLAAMRPGRSDRWYNWRRDAAGVFVRDTVSTVAGQLRRGS